MFEDWDFQIPNDDGAAREGVRWISVKVFDECSAVCFCCGILLHTPSDDPWNRRKEQLGLYLVPNPRVGIPKPVEPFFRVMNQVNPLFRSRVAFSSGFRKTSACLACTHQLRGDVDVDAYLARHDRFHALPLKADDHAANMKLLADPREALRDQLAVRQLCVITLYATPDLSAGPNSIAGRFAKSPMSRGAKVPFSYRLLEALAFQPLFTYESLGRCGPAIGECPAWSADGSLKQLRRYTLARLYGVDARFRANSDYVAFSLHRLAAYGCAKARGIVAGLPRPVVHFPEAAERFAAAGLVEVRLHEAILGRPGPGARGATENG